MTRVKDSLRDFILYIVKSGLSEGFRRECIPQEYHKGMTGCVRKSYLKKDPDGKYDYILTREAWQFINNQGLA